MGSGASKSTNNTTDITNSLMQVDNSVKQQIEENCTQSTSQNNVLNIINSKLQNATVDQKNVAKNVCALQAAFDDKVNIEIQNTIAATIAQHAAANGGSLLGGDAETANNVNIVNNSSTFINNSRVLSAVKNCVMKINQSNIANIINSDLSNTSFTQANDSFNECLQELNVKSEIEGKASNDTTTKVDQTGESTGGTLISPLSSASASGACIICIIVMAVIFLFFN